MLLGGSLLGDMPGHATVWFPECHQGRAAALRPAYCAAQSCVYVLPIPDYALYRSLRRQDVTRSRVPVLSDGLQEYLCLCHGWLSPQASPDRMRNVWSKSQSGGCILMYVRRDGAMCDNTCSTCMMLCVFIERSRCWSSLCSMVSVKLLIWKATSSKSQRLSRLHLFILAQPMR